MLKISLNSNYLICCVQSIITSVLNKQLTKQSVVHIQDQQSLPFPGGVEFLHLVIFYSTSNFSQIFLP